MKLAGNTSPRLLAQKDGGESTISSIELDATGSMKSRAPSLKQFPGPPPPRHPAHSYNNSHNSSYANSLRFPLPPQRQRSISDRIHNPSPTSFVDTKHLSPQQSTFAQQLAELPGSEPSDTSSSSHRLSTASSDVLGWDQPSIRQQPVNLGSPTHDRPFSAGTHPSLTFTNHDEQMVDAFADRTARDSIFTASSARSVAHPWPPDSTANSVLNYDSTSIYSDRRMQMPADVGMHTHDMPPTEPPIGLLRTRSVPGQYDTSEPYDRHSGSNSTTLDEDEDFETMSKKGIATRVQYDEFEKSAFRNSAILCDV